MDSKISFIGSGKMATAIASAMKKSFLPEQIAGFDISAEAAENFKKNTGLKTFSQLSEALNFAETLIIAVKPQNFIDLFDEIKDFASKKLIISIMAGIKISAISKKSNSKRIIRVMPNTPAIVNKGISAYAVSEKINEADIAIAEKILNCVGSSVQVSEDLMDAVTALSGSGPAYVFEFIEAMAKAGEKQGLTYDLALRLAIETVEGATALLKKSAQTPEKLRNDVTSPGGTTAKAIESLSKNNFRNIICSAISAAKERATELGKQYES